MASCWVTTGWTESGDPLVVLIFKNKPIDDDIDKAYKVIYPLEYKEVGFVNWHLQESLFIENN